MFLIEPPWHTDEFDTWIEWFRALRRLGCSILEAEWSHRLLAYRNDPQSLAAFRIQLLAMSKPLTMRRP